MTRFFPWWIAGVLALSGCASLGPGRPAKPAPKASDFGGSGIPPQLRAKAKEEGTPVSPGGNLSRSVPPQSFTPEEDIVFTDPDNPDAKLPELSALLPAAKRGPWEISETLAKRRAAREGKPLLIWFTDSVRSPMCKALSQELFATPAFEQWASEKLIRLRVDAQQQVTDPDLSLDEKGTQLVDIKHYIARLNKQYKAMGYPSVCLLNPSGEVIGRYRGYKRGQAEYFWGQLKQGEVVSSVAYQSWRAGLEKKGYREWQDRKGRKVFAKLTGCANGSVTLIEPDGTRSRTGENQLSDPDRGWLAEQKKLRNH